MKPPILAALVSAVQAEEEEERMRSTVIFTGAPQEDSDPIGDALRADAVAYWKINANVGGVFLDSKNTYNLTIWGTPTFDDDFAVFDNSSGFDDFDNFVILGDEDWTLAFEFKLSNTNAISFIRLYDSGGERAEMLVSNYSTMQFTDDNDVIFEADTGPGIITANTLHIIVFTYNSQNNTLRIMIDNGAETTADISAAVVTPVQIVEIYCESSDVVRLRRVGFWERLLTSDEKTYLYNAGAGRTLYP